MLAVHRSYLSMLRPILSRVHAMAHITGGGLPGNLNRALPSTLDAVVDTKSWGIPNLFQQLQRAGGVDLHEMFRTFNMGVGMTVLTPEPNAADVIGAAKAHGVHAWRLGVVRSGTGRVILD